MRHEEEFCPVENAKLQKSSRKGKQTYLQNYSETSFINSPRINLIQYHSQLKIVLSIYHHLNLQFNLAQLSCVVKQNVR